MPLSDQNPTTTKAWEKLSAHHKEAKSFKMRELFGDPGRADQFSINWHGVTLDYSKNIASEDTMELLRELANEMELKSAIDAQFSGEPINRTENRAVLHTALRAPKDSNFRVDGKNVMDEVESVREKMREFARSIIGGSRTGFTGKPFTHVVNIGIGGSDLGPAMAVEALAFYQNHLQIRFISNVDGDHVMESLKGLDPETTLFVIVSKTFTTQETLSNSETVRKWFLESASQKDVAKHFVAVSTNIGKVTAFGIDPDNVFPMWDWVGGRFSLWSAVGLSICLAVGPENFDRLLQGAHEMDEHFRTAPFEQNIPVTLALLSIWYNNFFSAETESIIPYSQYLQKLAPYLQQGIMESNGKSVGRNGKRVNYQTGTIIWGEPGTNSQHAFFQLIHQGTKIIPADFIGFAQSLHGNSSHQDKLMSNFFAQTQALMNGKSYDEAHEECMKSNAETADAIAPFKVFEGNKPTNTILIDKLTPESLGALIAMYEHKIFAQGIIWNIYSYDQWGVELGKQLANVLLSDIESDKPAGHDASTEALLTLYLKKRHE